MRTFRLVSAAAVIAAAASFGPQVFAGPTDWDTYTKYVDEAGNITLPADLHSVYVLREHVDYFREHGEFADGAAIEYLRDK